MEETLTSAAAESNRRVGRKENNVRSEQITLTLSAGSRDLLEELTDTGYFGKNAADTASMILWHALQEAAGKKLREMESLKLLNEYRTSRSAKAKMQAVKQLLADD